jgi:tagatose-1,6-bisphosphate aldolase
VTVRVPAGPSDVGRRRRLARLGGSPGIVSGIAIDHRDSLRATLAERGIGDLTDAQVRDLKLSLAQGLAPAATAIMIDAEFGGAALEAGVVPPSVALVMPLEAQGYEDGGDDRITTLLPDFSATDALRWGAEACKLLVPYRVDVEPAAAHQDAVIAATAEACHDVGLPLIVEPVVYRRSTESVDEFGATYEALVVAAVARIEPLGADLLKLPFPVRDLGVAGESGAAAACTALASACRATPWVLLGAGADTDTFVEQIGLAGRAGASGFLAGRGIWGPALSADPDAVGRAARGPALDAFRRCREAAERYASPLPGARAGSRAA